MPLLQLKDITVAFGGPPVLDGVDLAIEPGERLCLLGRNGAGKSTLLRVIQGTLEPDDGRILVDPGLRVATLAQQVPAALEGTVIDAVSGADSGGRGLREAHTAISRVGLEAHAPLAELSAGLVRRAMLARTLAGDPGLLLLDEPTNHLDAPSIEWLEEFLRRQACTLLFVTHDRAFLRRLATGILDLDRGRLARRGADYDRYREEKRRELHAELRRAARFDKKLAQEEDWLRQGVRERRKRNQGRVRRLESLREVRAERREVEGRLRIEAQPGARSGRIVLKAEGVGFAWPGRPVVRGLTATILRGDRVGIVGPNGSGKTTLLQLLLGELEPQAGRIRRGANLEVAYFDQLHARLDLDATAAENVSGGGPTLTVNGKTRQAVSYLRNFLFTADQARSVVRTFSGGERNRLLLARVFARPSNLLVLDEPTNDLDIETLEVLEDLLADYEGTVLLVSHDRELLDRVATGVLVLEGEGRAGAYVGGYTDWLRQREAGEAPPQAKRRKGRRAAKAPPTSPLDRAEKRELRDLPGRIETLEAERAALHAEMAEPAFFRQEGEHIAAAKARLRALEAEIQAAYTRWEALEAKGAGELEPPY